LKIIDKIRILNYGSYDRYVHYKKIWSNDLQKFIDTFEASKSYSKTFVVIEQSS
jgi:hypothetical protein